MNKIITDCIEYGIIYAIYFLLTFPTEKLVNILHKYSDGETIHLTILERLVISLVIMITTSL